MADLSDQSVFVSLNLQVARVEHLAGVLLYAVVVGVEPFEDYDEVLGEVRYLHVDQSFSLNLALGPQVILHQLLDINVVLNLVEDSLLLELETDDGEAFLLHLRRQAFVLG